MLLSTCVHCWYLCRASRPRRTLSGRRTGSWLRRTQPGSVCTHAHTSPQNTVGCSCSWHRPDLKNKECKIYKSQEKWYLLSFTGNGSAGYCFLCKENKAFQQDLCWDINHSTRNWRPLKCSHQVAVSIKVLLNFPSGSFTAPCKVFPSKSHPGVTLIGSVWRHDSSWQRMTGSLCPTRLCVSLTEQAWSKTA